MGFARKIKVPCYICETKFMAGVFLSLEIASRKPYCKGLHVRRFESFREAKETFLENYECVSREEFRVNCLHEVRERNIYVVFSTKTMVGIVEAEKQEVLLPILLGKNYLQAYLQPNLTFEEAQKIARNKFVKIYKSCNLYISKPIPLNKPITLWEVIRKRKEEAV